MPTIQTTLRDATAQLKAHSPEPESASFEAQLLLTHVLKVNRAWLIAHADDAISELDNTTFEALLARRLAGEPMAYILGEREFFGLNLKVTPDTLIPRPDTEVLVETALDKLVEGNGNDILKVLDLGTGTGAIALAIAKHAPKAQVTAVDFSKGALQVAQANAQHLNIQNVAFVHSDWFSALSDAKFDLIVSNPPYIEEADPHLNRGDVRFEPKSALTSGADGLDDIRHIITQTPRYLKPNGWLLLEHGYNQAANVAALLAQSNFSHIGHATDLAGIQRVTFGQI